MWRSARLQPRNCTHLRLLVLVAATAADAGRDDIVSASPEPRGLVVVAAVKDLPVLEHWVAGRQRYAAPPVARQVLATLEQRDLNVARTPRDYSERHVG